MLRSDIDTSIDIIIDIDIKIVTRKRVNYKQETHHDKQGFLIGLKRLLYNISPQELSAYEGTRDVTLLSTV